MTIPKTATSVPIQKFVLGFGFKNKNDAIPTQTGDKLVNNVACVALDSCIEIFQTATSEPNKIPQNTANSRYGSGGILNWPENIANGIKTINEINIR